MVISWAKMTVPSSITLAKVLVAVPSGEEPENIDVGEADVIVDQ